MITSQNQLGAATSSARYKENIQPIDKSSETVLSLKPVTFRYKKEFIRKPSLSLAWWLKTWQR